MPRNAERDPDFFDFDLHALHKEWHRQPKLYHKYAMMLVDAKAALDAAEAQLALRQADLDGGIRARPERYGLEKITEGAIKALILTDGQFQNDQQAVADCQRRVGELQVAVQTLDHRKKALENVVQLWLADYFSEPTVRDGAATKEKARMRRRMEND
jgi:hypothetical protein